MFNFLGSQIGRFYVGDKPVSKAYFQGGLIWSTRFKDKFATGQYSLVGSSLVYGHPLFVDLDSGTYALNGFALNVSMTSPAADTIRFTQAFLEVSVTRPSKLYVTQTFLEVSSNRNSKLYVTQVFLEITRDQ